jgi:integrase
MPAELKTVSADRPKPGDTPEQLAAKSARRKEKAAQRKIWHRQWCSHPHQLRHTAATELRKTHGLEAAQVILGHKTLTVTQLYAEKNVEAAMKIMAEIG